MEENKNTAQYHVQDNSDVEGSIISAATKHYVQGNYKEALKLFVSTITTNANSETYLNIGNCYYMMHEHPQAIEAWNKAISLDPKNSKAYTNLGNLYYKNEEIEKAISFWLVSLISKPEDENTNLNLAIAFNKKNMQFESIKYFEKYLKYAEDKSTKEYLEVKERIENCYKIANEYLTYGVQLQSNEEHEKAASCYFKSLANYPNLSKTNLNLGSIFFSNNNYELAIKYWKVAAQLDPNYDKMYSNLAISYDLLEQFDYAYCYYIRYSGYITNNKEEYNKVNRRIYKIKPLLIKNAKLIESHLKKAQQHLAESELYDAIEEFENYCILKPEEKNTYKDIIKKLKSYLNPEPSIIENCFEIGNQLINEKKYSEAKPYFWRIMNLSSQKHLEFSKARAKYSQCEREE